MAAGFLCVFIWFLNIILPEVKDTRRIGAKPFDFWKRLDKYIREKRDICISSSLSFGFAATSNWSQKMNKLTENRAVLGCCMCLILYLCNGQIRPALV